jgi:hypothetical protein
MLDTLAGFARRGLYAATSAFSMPVYKQVEATTHTLGRRMDNDPLGSGPTPGHSAHTSQGPNSAKRSPLKATFKANFARIGKVLTQILIGFVNTFIFIIPYPWIGALLAVGCVVVGIFQPLSFTAAIVTSIGAFAVLLGSLMQAFAAYMTLVGSSDTSSDKSRSWLGRAFSSFMYEVGILLYQYHGWILLLSGGTFLLAGAVMAAITLA